VPDCHVETYRDARQDGLWRAYAVHTASGRVLYVTWPYADEQSASARAGRWLREEYGRAESLELFEDCEKRPG
jgi:hypothetical protein